MTSDGQDRWIPVPDHLMTGVVEELATWFPKPAPHTLKVGESDVPVSLIDGLITYLSEDLGCDHSVNICMCGPKELVYQLKLAREGKRVCPDCGGEGFVMGSDDSDEMTPDPCPACKSSGTVDMEAV